MHRDCNALGIMHLGGGKLSKLELQCVSFCVLNCLSATLCASAPGNSAARSYTLFASLQV